jgi:hypothetical protein
VTRDERFAPMTCQDCGAQVRPILELANRNAVSRDTCMYRCGCGTCYSNARAERNRRKIVASPELNVPEQVRPGLEQVLSQAVNERNRPTKAWKFCSDRTEDAATWTVFRYLQNTGCLGLIVSGEASSLPAPGVLFWGVPAGGSDAEPVAEQLENISRSLGERASARTEPDVIVVWPNLLVVIEVKLGSGNDRQPGKPAFERYLDQAHLYGEPKAAIMESGYYELVRNWRIGAELAERRACEGFLLVNLGPPRLAQDMAVVTRQFATAPRRRFDYLGWRLLWRRIAASGSAPWFDHYLGARCESGGRRALRLEPLSQQGTHLPLRIGSMNPRGDLEVRDPQRWLPALHQRNNVGKGVAERTLAVPPTLAREQRRTGFCEAAALQTGLRLAAVEP